MRIRPVPQAQGTGTVIDSADRRIIEGRRPGRPTRSVGPGRPPVEVILQPIGAGLEIPVGVAEEILRGSDACLLDVREDWEYRRGHVPGALHIPLGHLPLRMAELPTGRKVLVICEHGNRSLAAAHYLRNRGFSDAVSIAGGTNAWVRGNRPVEQGDSR